MNEIIESICRKLAGCHYDKSIASSRTIPREDYINADWVSFVEDTNNTIQVLIDEAHQQAFMFHARGGLNAMRQSELAENWLKQLLDNKL
jgi:hypothetical protein